MQHAMIKTSFLFTKILAISKKLYKNDFILKQIKDAIFLCIIKLFLCGKT